jgi:hypothetical protein
MKYTRFHGKSLHVKYKVNHGALLERWKRFTDKYGLVRHSTEGDDSCLEHSKTDISFR